jgi:hypothetical protein
VCVDELIMTLQLLFRGVEQMPLRKSTPYVNLILVLDLSSSRDSDWLRSE